jgi:hypothetical protein
MENVTHGCIYYILHKHRIRLYHCEAIDLVVRGKTQVNLLKVIATSLQQTTKRSINNKE